MDKKFQPEHTHFQCSSNIQLQDTRITEGLVHTSTSTYQKKEQDEENTTDIAPKPRRQRLRRKQSEKTIGNKR